MSDRQQQRGDGLDRSRGHGGGRGRGTKKPQTPIQKLRMYVFLVINQKHVLTLAEWSVSMPNYFHQEWQWTEAGCKLVRHRTNAKFKAGRREASQWNAHLLSCLV